MTAISIFASNTVKHKYRYTRKARHMCSPIRATKPSFTFSFPLVREQFQLTVACLRGFGAHRRDKIGPQRSAKSAEQGPKRAQATRWRFAWAGLLAAGFGPFPQSLLPCRTPGGRGTESSVILLINSSLFLIP